MYLAGRYYGRAECIYGPLVEYQELVFVDISRVVHGWIGSMLVDIDNNSVVYE